MGVGVGIGFEGGGGEQQLAILAASADQRQVVVFAENAEHLALDSVDVPDVTEDTAHRLRHAVGEEGLPPCGI